MGYTHIDVDPEEAYVPSGGQRNDNTSKLSELLEWERKQRAEAQARILELEKQLGELQLSSAAEIKRLNGELATAHAATSGACIERDNAIVKHDKLRLRGEELAELLDEARASRDEALKQLRAAEILSADAARGRKRRTDENLKRVAASLAALRADWTAVRTAAHEHKKASAELSTEQGAQLAAVAGAAIAREGASWRAQLEAAEQASSAQRKRLEEQLAEALAEVRRLREALHATGPAAEAAANELKKARADAKRLQDLVNLFKGNRTDAGALERERDEALAAAAAAAASEKKARQAVESERAKCAAATTRADDACAELAASRSEIDELRRALEHTERTLSHAQRRKSSVTVSADALRALEGAARELYVSGGRGIEAFLAALARVEGTVEQVDGTGATVPPAFASSSRGGGASALLGVGDGASADAAAACGERYGEREGASSTAGGTAVGAPRAGSRCSSRGCSRGSGSRGSGSCMSDAGGSGGGDSRMIAELSPLLAPYAPEGGAADAAGGLSSGSTSAFGGFTASGARGRVAVPVGPHAFGSRARIPSGERAKRGERLPAVSSVPSIAPSRSLSLLSDAGLNVGGGGGGALLRGGAGGGAASAGQAHQGLWQDIRGRPL